MREARRRTTALPQLGEAFSKLGLGEFTQLLGIALPGEREEDDVVCVHSDGLRKLFQALSRDGVAFI